MSQDSMEKVGNVREGQFGAIGTRRDQRSVSATQPLSSSSMAGPDVNMFTATTNSNANTGDLLNILYYMNWILSRYDLTCLD